MKYLCTTIIFALLISTSEAQIKSLGLLIGAGYTAIDVQKVNDPILLSDWNNYSLVFKGFGEYQLKERTCLGIELGRNRLYYWNYVAPGYSYHNWRTEWTTNVVIYFSKYLNDNLFIQAGPGVHSFYNGTVFGLLVGAGTSIPISENLAIPLLIRAEPIFGSGTPVALNIGTGIRFNLK